MVHNCDPDYNFLKVFGCECWPNLRPYLSKLKFRSISCLFLDYSNSHKGYKCLDLSNNRLYISRDVLFNENSFPLAKSRPSNPSIPSITTQASLPLFLPSILGPLPTNSQSAPPSLNSTPSLLGHGPIPPSPISQTTLSSTFRSPLQITNALPTSNHTTSITPPPTRPSTIPYHHPSPNQLITTLPLPWWNCAISRSSVSHHHCRCSWWPLKLLISLQVFRMACCHGPTICYTFSKQHLESSFPSTLF